MAAAFNAALELYAITDQDSAKGRTDTQVAAALIQGGATALQYRAKKVDAARQYKEAVSLRALCARARIPFIVNDRLDLALAVGADGLHLGQDDLPLEAARRLSLAAGRPLVLGKSTHSLEQALAAEKEGADYIGFGPIFDTRTKENNVAAVGTQALGRVLEAVSLPVVAIGGIKPANVEAVAACAMHVAVVTHFTSAKDVARAVAAFKAQWKELRQPAKR